MSKNDGGAAFPQAAFIRHDDGFTHSTPESDGMTLRDYFAAKAMAALVGNAPSYSQMIGRIGSAEWLSQQAIHAYAAADALIKERAK